MPTIGNLGTMFVRGDNKKLVPVPCIQGKNGITPHIGENGNWWIGDTDTGAMADNKKYPVSASVYETIFTGKPSEYTLEILLKDGEMIRAKLPNMGLTPDDVVEIGIGEPSEFDDINYKQFYLDKNTGRLYINTSNMYPNSYITIGGVVLSGENDPTGGEDAYINNLYINTTTGAIFLCVRMESFMPSEPPHPVWQQIGGTGVDVGTDITLGITGAVVGKTVKITEVDEDGRPVKWEAADIPARTDIDSTLSIEGAAADAAEVGKKFTELSSAIADKLNRTGDTLRGKFVIPTAVTTAGFVNSEDMKIFGYGTNNFRMGDPNKPLELRGSGTNPMFGSKKILVEGDVTGDSLLTVETITVGDDSGETETVSVTGLSLDLTTYSATVGNGFYINPVITPSNATNKAVSWQSNATNIATVNSSGYVECITAGNAVITCTTVDGGFTATCAVSVAAVDSGETTGQKIQYSTLAITSGYIKKDGTTATMGSTYNVTIPYSEGMQIITGTNLSWDRSVYPPVVVYDNGTYISPEVTQVGEARSVGGKYSTPFTATLTGFTENAIVHASFLAGGTIGDTLETNMDNADIFYYIPGGYA